MADEEQPDLFGWLDGTRDGGTFDRRQDLDRLNKQARRVYGIMRDGRWHRLNDIAAATGDPEASVSARLRDLRKKKFGAWVVEHRRSAEGRGTWEYRIFKETING